MKWIQHYFIPLVKYPKHKWLYSNITYLSHWFSNPDNNHKKLVLEQVLLPNLTRKLCKNN